ncbi:MAG TPA: caspase family protein [Bryobacteraceae bacterium]
MKFVAKHFIAVLFAGTLMAQVADPLGQRDILVRRVASASELSSKVQIRRGFALVIGVAKYKNLSPEDNLKFSESDAETVYRTVISKEGGNIEPENVKKLIGPQATLANIRKALEEWLVTSAQEQDRVIVFFAGHGLVSNGRGYLAPYDVDVKDIEHTAYPMTRLGDMLGNKVKAGWKVLLADACHSGKVTAETTQENVYNALHGLPENFLTLTSSRESESSYEDPSLAGGFGLFSYFLTQGWMGAADVDPRDGIVTADELIEYVRREVRDYARHRGRNQTPTDRGDFPADMMLGFSAERRQKLITVTAPQLANGSLVVEVNLDDVEVYIDDKLVGTASMGKTLQVPGIATGTHVVKGVRMGYDPASKDVLVVPGQDTTVTLRIQYKRTVKKSALEDYKKGLDIYGRRKSEADLKRAEDFFTTALKEDANYSEAALMLCLTQQILQQTDEGAKSCKRAVDTDPDYVEARVAYGALLVETGDTSEAIRQLSEATRRDPKNSQAYSHLAEAFLLAKAYDKSEEAASKAISLSAKNSQAFLFRGDAKRMQKRYTDAIPDYNKYLELDDFVAPVYQKIPVFLIGFGMSYRNAGQKRVYATQRSSAFFGLCGCETELKNFLRARDYCEKAIAADKNDATSYNMLGTIYMDLFNRDNRRDYLVRAQDSLSTALQLSPDADFAPEAKQNLKQVREILPQVK